MSTFLEAHTGMYCLKKKLEGTAAFQLSNLKVSQHQFFYCSFLSNAFIGNHKLFNPPHQSAKYGCGTKPVAPLPKKKDRKNEKWTELEKCPSLIVSHTSENFRLLNCWPFCCNCVLPHYLPVAVSKNGNPFRINSREKVDKVRSFAFV